MEPFREVCALLSGASMSERVLYLSSNILIRCKLILIIKGIRRKLKVNRKLWKEGDNILIVNEENFVHG